MQNIPVMQRSISQGSQQVPNPYIQGYQNFQRIQQVPIPYIQNQQQNGNRMGPSVEDMSASMFYENPQEFGQNYQETTFESSSCSKCGVLGRGRIVGGTIVSKVQIKIHNQSL